MTESNPLHKILIIQKSRDYWDDQSIDAEEFDQLVRQILDNQAKAEKYDKLSNAEKYNVCNDDKEGYCIFEKQADELQPIVDKLKQYAKLGDTSRANVAKEILENSGNSLSRLQEVKGT